MYNMFKYVVHFVMFNYCRDNKQVRLTAYCLRVLSAICTSLTVVYSFVSFDTTTELLFRFSFSVNVFIYFFRNDFK